MGKGKRNSRERLENQAANREAELAKKKAQKKKNTSDKVITTVCIVFALLIVAVLVLSVLSESGVFLRGQLAMGRDGIEVNSAMMTYWVNEYITNWYSENYMYIAYYKMYSLDMSKDFSSQYLTASDANYLGENAVAGMSWYDYFLTEVATNVKMYVTYAANAEKAGMAELSAEDKSEIDKTIKSMKDSFKSSGMSFADQYGKGVTEKDVRACYELVYIASNYSEHIQETYKTQLESDTEVKKDVLLSFIDKNKGDFYSADVFSYTYNLSSKDFDNDKAYQAMVELVKGEFDKIKEAKDSVQFLEFVEDFKEEYDTKAETSSTTKTETETETETETKDPLDDYRNTVTYETKDELGKWLFEESADVNDVKVVEETGTETEKATTSKKESTTTESSTETGKTDGKKTYNTFKITVYMVDKKADLDRTATHNLAYVLSDNKANAQAFLDAFKASKDKSAKSFEELAEKHYNTIHKVDDNGDHNHAESETEPVFNYEKAEKLAEGSFAKVFGKDYAKLDDWVDSEERKAGDLTAELIEIKVDGKTHYAVVFLENHDDEVWHVNSFNGVLSERIDEWYKGELEKNPVTNNLAWVDIQIVRYSMGY